MSKAHAIVSELLVALDREVAPELCDNLAAVYDFSLARLSDANREANANHVVEVMRALTPLREAWKLAVPRAIAEASEQKGDKP